MCNVYTSHGLMGAVCDFIYVCQNWVRFIKTSKENSIKVCTQEYMTTTTYVIYDHISKREFLLAMKSASSKNDFIYIVKQSVIGMLIYIETCCGDVLQFSVQKDINYENI